MKFHALSRRMLWAACVYILLAMTVDGAPEKYEVKSLPGWNQPLPSKMYSGWNYAGTPPNNASGSMHMHYWFIESERDPANDPVVVWYNGGPGASSLFGLLIELGPLLLNVDSLENSEYNRTGIPQMIRNAFSWTKVASVLAVDNPPPVGFSYCEPAGPTGDGRSCGPWNDSLVAAANHEFLANWIQDFPEYASNDLYLTGESYAGVYVPTIAREILKEPRGLNLKGFAVGDGCMGTEVLCGDSNGPYYYVEWMHGHGQFSQQLHRTIRAECPEEDLRSGNLTKQCHDLVTEMETEIGGYYGYNLYDECWDQHVFSKDRLWFGPPPFSLPSPTSKSKASRNLGGALNDYPCPGPAMMMWLNRTDVRKSLNAPADAYFFSGDNGEGFNYSLTEPNLLPFYGHVIRNTSLRVLVYNGDTDPGINSFITQDKYFDYLSSVGIDQVQKWRPWTRDGKKLMAGYVTEYKGDFSYLTIRGSGHMVPEFKPAAALSFLSYWLEGKDFPRYNPGT